MSWPLPTPHERLLAAAYRTGQLELATQLEAIVDAAQGERPPGLDRPAEALAYARAGVPVFPIVPLGKRPAIPSAHPPGDRTCHGECGRDGHGLYDATTELERVEAWWRRWPVANIGTRTGLAFDVVDVDGPDGVLSLVELLPLLDVLAIVSTPRAGGLHVYVPPTGEGNGTKLWAGVDYRGEGGYVLLPPSAHDEHGALGSYRWLRPLASLTPAVLGGAA